MAGLERLTKARSKKREALTWDLLVRLITLLLRGNVGLNVILFMLVQHVFGLRFGECSQLPWPCVVRSGPTLQIEVPAFKNWDTTTCAILPLSTIPPVCLELFALPWPATVLTSVNQTTLNTYIKVGMQTLGVKGWFTNHSLKHGRCVDLRCRYGMALAEIGAVVRLRSKATVLLYSSHPKVAPTFDSIATDLPPELLAACRAALGIPPAFEQLHL